MDASRRGEASESSVGGSGFLESPFSSPYMLKAQACIRSSIMKGSHCGEGGRAHLLQLTIIYIVTAPIGHRIELYAMRELHLVFLEKPLELLAALLFSSRSSRIFVAVVGECRAGREWLELDVVGEVRIRYIGAAAACQRSDFGLDTGVGGYMRRCGV